MSNGANLSREMGNLIVSRRFPRVEAAFPVQVQEASGPPWEGKATDLSPFGVKVRGASIAPWRKKSGSQSRSDGSIPVS